MVDRTSLEAGKSLQICVDLEALSLAAAKRFTDLAAQAIGKRGAFHVALAGGATPRRLYQHLAMPMFAERIAWQHVHIYFGDERAVPPDDPDSNYLMAHEALLRHVPIPDTHIHRINGAEKDLSQSAMDYERVLRQQLTASDGLFPQFDLVLLGIGPDGHIASLFPDTPILKETSKLVAAVYVAKLFTWRISLTLPVINNALHIMVLAAGENKTVIIRQVFIDDASSDHYPVQLLHPAGELEWYLDAAAARALADGARA